MDWKRYAAVWVALPSLGIGFSIMAATFASEGGVIGGFLFAATATVAVACFLTPLALLNKKLSRP